MTIPFVLPPMTEQQRATFAALYPGVQRDPLLGVLLAILLGSFGAHHFYLRRNGLGVVYLIFFWTGVPAILGFIEAFFMPGRVERFNAEQAALLANAVVHGTAAISLPASMVGCVHCGKVQTSGVRYCVQCGQAMA